MKRILSIVLACISLGISAFQLHAQETFRENGAPYKVSGKYLFVNANIVSRYDATPIFGYLLIENGKVSKIGTGQADIKDAIKTDLNGAWIYPAFIDLFSTYGIEQPQNIPFSIQPPQLQSNTKGAYAWNEALKPEFRAHEIFSPNQEAATPYLKNGVAMVLSRKKDGFSRGSGVLLSLNQENAHQNVVVPKATHEMSFQRGTSQQEYPTSLMGAIALLRQTFYDAQWYASSPKGDLNISLEKWNELNTLPIFFEANSWQNALRAANIAKEFNKKIIVKGGGNEYQRADEIKAAGIPVVLPLHFPEAYDVSNPAEANYLNLSDLKHWELAPANPAILASKGIQLAFTMDGLKEQTILGQIKKCLKYGLSEQDALKALTFTPAELLGVSQQAGSLETGKWANFIVTDKPLFHPQSGIYACWVKGKEEWSETIPVDLKSKTYSLKTENLNAKLVWLTKDKNSEVKIYLKDSTSTNVNLNFDGRFIRLDWKNDSTGFYRLNGWKKDNGFEGSGTDPKGKTFSWQMTLVNDSILTSTTPKKDSLQNTIGKIWYPFQAYGRTELPTTEKILFKNVTVWTNEKDGILQQSDVLIDKGKIVAIGKNLPANDAKLVDGTGKHLTNGIIDEHSHIAIEGGVNEAGWTSSSEVRIGDVLRDDDINIYRQLAGGVVGAQLLHGSANAIGGQSALVKFKWGLSPDSLKWKNTDGFIKFALGENVKQSNWGDLQTIRFPQTRMGVEQVYMDYFSRAKEYSLQTSKRRDLALDALVEILQKKRFITCHSYVQSEINMLMKVAEHFDFKINTFTHILEGYKVADIMKKHGCGASTFADWWGYKYEVTEAIPYNAALMNEVGLVTAINSDDAEMARRLNQEAAKAVKYGGTSEEDAWKMVTLNPAKLLHVDHKTGSIAVGKDADLVLWSANPLSVYAFPVQTYVEGICYFDIAADAQLRLALEAERNRIIQKMMEEIRNGASARPVAIPPDKEYHCEDIEMYFGFTGFEVK